MGQWIWPNEWRMVPDFGSFEYPTPWFFFSSQFCVGRRRRQWSESENFNSFKGFGVPVNPACCSGFFLWCECNQTLRTILTEIFNNSHSNPSKLTWFSCSNVWWTSRFFFWFQTEFFSSVSIIQNECNHALRKILIENNFNPGE